MNDSEILDWCEHYLLDIRYVGVNKMVIKFFNKNGDIRIVSGISLRDAIRGAVVKYFS